MYWSTTVWTFKSLIGLPSCSALDLTCFSAACLNWFTASDLSDSISFLPAILFVVFLNLSSFSSKILSIEPSPEIGPLLPITFPLSVTFPSASFLTPETIFPLSSTCNSANLSAAVLDATIAAWFACDTRAVAPSAAKIAVSFACNTATVLASALANLWVLTARFAISACCVTVTAFNLVCELFKFAVDIFASFVAAAWAVAALAALVCAAPACAVKFAAAVSAAAAFSADLVSFSLAAINANSALINLGSVAATRLVTKASLADSLLLVFKDNWAVLPLSVFACAVLVAAFAKFVVSSALLLVIIPACLFASFVLVSLCCVNRFTRPCSVLIAVFVVFNLCWSLSTYLLAVFSKPVLRFKLASPAILVVSSNALLWFKLASPVILVVFSNALLWSRLACVPTLAVFAALKLLVSVCIWSKMSCTSTSTIASDFCGLPCLIWSLRLSVSFLMSSRLFGSKSAPTRFVKPPPANLAYLFILCSFEDPILLASSGV